MVTLELRFATLAKDWFRSWCKPSGKLTPEYNTDNISFGAKVMAEVYICIGALMFTINCNMSKKKNIKVLRCMLDLTALFMLVYSCSIIIHI